MNAVRGSASSMRGWKLCGKTALWVQTCLFTGCLVFCSPPPPSKDGEAQIPWGLLSEWAWPQHMNFWVFWGQRKALSSAEEAESQDRVSSILQRDKGGRRRNICGRGQCSRQIPRGGNFSGRNNHLRMRRPAGCLQWKMYSLCKRIVGWGGSLLYVFCTIPKIKNDFSELITNFLLHFWWKLRFFILKLKNFKRGRIHSTAWTLSPFEMKHFSLTTETPLDSKQNISNIESKRRIKHTSRLKFNKVHIKSTDRENRNNNPLERFRTNSLPSCPYQR